MRIKAHAHNRRLAQWRVTWLIKHSTLLRPLDITTVTSDYNKNICSI